VRYYKITAKESTMENISIIRAKFQEAVDDYNASHSEEASYYEGKIVGYIEALSFIKGISYIEADVLLRNVQ
jgi:hypothetical protein